MDMKDLNIETDAPYLDGNGRQTGCLSMVREIAMKLSGMFNMTLPDVAAVTTSNTLKLYKI
jgi:Tat protein secretion system quality control protein TatD with DNase activity